MDTATVSFVPPMDALSRRDLSVLASLYADAAHPMGRDGEVPVAEGDVVAAFARECADRMHTEVMAEMVRRGPVPFVEEVGSDPVGVATVIVSPDVSGFDAALRLELAAIFGRLERDIRATIV